MNKTIIAFIAAWLSAQALAQTKDSVVIAWESELRFIDPRYAIDANSQYLEDLVGCSLIAFDAAGQSTPDLASEMPVWVDHRNLSVKIKDGVHFSDGSTLTAQ